MLWKVEVKIKYLLHIHIFPSDDWHQEKIQWLSNFGAATTNWYLSEIFKEKSEVFHNLLLGPWSAQCQNEEHVGYLHSSLI